MASSSIRLVVVYGFYLTIAPMEESCRLRWSLSGTARLLEGSQISYHALSPGESVRF